MNNHTETKGRKAVFRSRTQFELTWRNPNIGNQKNPRKKYKKFYFLMFGASGILLQLRSPSWWRRRKIFHFNVKEVT
jgi:hypothetical protein